MDEHSFKMKKTFPKYPCTACQKYDNGCLRYACPRWRKWFKEEWNELRKSLGANVEE